MKLPTRNVWKTRKDEPWQDSWKKYSRTTEAVALIFRDSFVGLLQSPPAVLQQRTPQNDGNTLGSSISEYFAFKMTAGRRIKMATHSFSIAWS